MAAHEIALINEKDFELPAMMDTEYDAAEFEEEFNDTEVNFLRVKIPSGGATSFEIPDPLNPEETNPAKVLAGIIVYQHKANGYWPEGDSMGNPPACSSSDGKTGEGEPGGACSLCPLNEWGSGEGGSGKACKNMMQVYLLQSGDMFPVQLSLPPTSIKPFNQYMSRLRMNGLLPSKVLTSISLKKEESNGNPYAVAVFRAEQFEPGFSKQTTQYAREFKQRLLGLQSGIESAEKTRTPEGASTPTIDKEDANCPF